MIRISPSRINTFRKCPALYHYSYERPEIERETTVPMLKGTVVHWVLEQMGAMRWDEIEKFTESDTRLYARLVDLCLKHLSDYYDMDALKAFCEEKEESFMVVMDDMAWCLRGWCLWYARRFFATVRQGKRPWLAWKYLCPTHTELRIEHPLWGDKVLLTGVIDGVFVENLNEDTAHTIQKTVVGLTDYKTGNIFKLPLSDEYWFQLMFYAYLWKQKTGEYPTCVSLFYTRSMDNPVFDVPENVGEIVMDKVCEFVDAKEKDEYPGNPDYRFCYMERKNAPDIKCEFYDICGMEKRR